MIKVAPSILAADPLDLRSGVRRMTEAGCDWIHVDVMDAHFVPNLAYTPAVVKALKPETDRLLDVHLMMDNPELLVDTFAEAGAGMITIHAEIPGDAAALLRHIREMGILTGIALKPGTPVSALDGLLELTDMMLVMTVEPGFGGQRFQPEMVDKIRALRAMGYTGEIESDGGINRDRLAMLGEAGLTVAVMGTALFRSEDPAGDIAYAHSL